MAQTLLTTPLPPYSIHQGTSGFALDIAHTLANAQGWSLQTIFVPWARAQKMTVEGSDLLITPLTRTPSREAHYDWLIPVHEYKLELITNDPSLPINDLDAVRSETVCVMRSSPAENMAESLGLDNSIAVSDGGKCMELLGRGRYKLVLTHGLMDASWAYQNYGFDPDKLIQVASLPGGMLYIASSKGMFTTQQRGRISDWYKAFRKSQDYRTLLQKYHLSIEPLR